MRNLSSDSPSLFAAEGVVAEAAILAGSPGEQEREKKAELVAREFVKWCCSFGADFRNSPDFSNLQCWRQKVRLKLNDDEQGEVIVEARRLFAKKIEQITRKADASLPQMNTMSE